MRIKSNLHNGILLMTLYCRFTTLANKNLRPHNSLSTVGTVRNEAALCRRVNRPATRPSRGFRVVVVVGRRSPSNVNERALQKVFNFFFLKEI